MAMRYINNESSSIFDSNFPNLLRVNISFAERGITFILIVETGRVDEKRGKCGIGL